MSVLRSEHYRAASKRVLGWCSWYTRDLAPEVAAARRDEIASDLHEHATWADETGTPSKQVKRDILTRALRGAPADLAWRARQQRATPLPDAMSVGTRRVGDVLAAVVFAAGVGLAGLAVFVLVRVLRALVIGDIPNIPRHHLLVMVLAVVAISAVGALLWKRARFIGAIVLAGIALPVVYLSVQILVLVSATVGSLAYRSAPGAWGFSPIDLVTFGTGAGLVLLFAGAAVWWWPAPRKAPSSGRVGDGVPTTTGPIA